MFDMKLQSDLLVEDVIREDRKSDDAEGLINYVFSLKLHVQPIKN